MKRDTFRIGVALLPAVVALSLLMSVGCKKKQEEVATTTVTPPAPVRPSKVFLEIDRMLGTPEVPLSVTLGGNEVSLKKIYADAGIDLVVQQDQIDLPRLDKIRLAELHGLMSSANSLMTPPGFTKVHMLVVPEEVERPDLGVMFDFADRDANSLPREGFAVFTTLHERMDNAPAELLLTTAHELAHCFNLHHSDWEGTSYTRDATIESYSLAGTVRWKLSPNSIEHIKTHLITEVWPGQGGLPFGSVARSHLSHHQSDPPESYSVIDADSPAARGLTGPAASRKGLAREIARLREVQADPVRLSLEANQASYVVSDPVVLGVGIHNTGSEDRYVLPLLDPRYQFLNVEIRKPGDTEFRAFRSPVLGDARGVKAVRLKPGDVLHEDIKIFFGTDGWTFKEPGTYEVRADYPAGGSPTEAFDQRERVQSPVMTLQIKSATTSTDSRTVPQVLNYTRGLYLYLEGASHLKGAHATYEKIVREEPNSTVAPAARLALAQAELNPALEPGSRVAPAPDAADVEKARVYLQGLPTETLPARSVVRATEQLSVEMQKRGDAPEAARLRATARQIERQETVKDRQRMRRITTGVQP
jgi:hypothetical protein